MPRWLLFLTFAVGIAAQQPSPDNQLASIDGAVVNAVSKEPVRKAHVTLSASDGSQNTQLVAITDEVGHFRFADLSPGRYRLSAQKSGFLDASYGANQLSQQGSLLLISKAETMSDLADHGSAFH